MMIRYLDDRPLSIVSCQAAVKALWPSIEASSENRFTGLPAPNEEPMSRKSAPHRGEAVARRCRGEVGPVGITFRPPHIQVCTGENV